MRYFACLLLIIVSPFITVAKTITLVADEWYPVNGDPKSDKPGYMIEIAKEIFKEKGYEVIYKIKPWERSILETRLGKEDCVVGAAKEDAPDFIFPSASFGHLDIGFYTHQSSPWVYEGIESLKQKALGAMSGYSYDDGELDAYIQDNQKTPKIQLEFGNNGLDKLIKLLQHQRIDIIIETPAIMDSKIKEQQIQDIKLSGKLGLDRSMYIACTPVKDTTDQYIKWLDEGLTTLRQNGRLKTILDKYGLKDWQN